VPSGANSFSLNFLVFFLNQEGVFFFSDILS
jgi:hypothetical protein